MKTSRILSLLLVCLWVVPVFAQEGSTKTMGIVRDAAKSNKKALIAVNLNLTEAEEKGFWPLYDSYQADLEKIQERQLNLIKDYAKDYNANSLTDEKAKKLMADYMATEEDTLKLNKTYFSKFDKVLPGKKVVAYYQLENKIEAIIAYEMAGQIPLVE
jgi:hypothetical protein